MRKYKRQPCAYCGRTDVKRERGHVIPACMYPSGTELGVQRRTVPECVECKKLWQEAESHFRNVLVIAGTPNTAVLEQWHGPVRRSFDKRGGRQRLTDLVEQIRLIETPEGPRHIIYPGDDSKVMLVIRKIIRGLCHYHGISSRVSDKQVWADVLRYRIPLHLSQRLQYHHIGTQFLEYGYEVTDDKNLNIHSAWYLKFYGQREFVAIVSHSENVAPPDVPASEGPEA